ncbi:MAG: anion transporter [Gammaproteobacteria bacterium SG8_47]|nr:MAG: anion transporter [Gammaproteobacteria bacterium SG8_47]
MVALPGRSAIGLWLGLLLFVLLLALPPPQDMPPSAWRAAAVATLMATWWITEAIPIAATALLPIALFPLLGVMPTPQVTTSYANHLIYLFLGGFLIAMAMQKWNLHRRIALRTIRVVGVSPPRIVLGFMLATAFLSMWISNTATAMMMLPIALAVIGQIREMTSAEAAEAERSGEEAQRFATALMLGIAYAASIGGVATLIGTPPNAILAGVVERLYGFTIGFAAWMAFGLPLAAVMLAIAWIYLVRFVYAGTTLTLTGASELVAREIAALGAMSREEKWILTIFSMVALLWIIRGFLDLRFLGMASDATIAIAGALLLFMIPSNWRKREFLLDWASAVQLPWDILILFGGGFALAHGFSESGLTQWIASQLSALSGVHLSLLVLAVAVVVLFLTEVTSNTATATLILPVLGATSEAVGVHPFGLMVPAAVAASYAFMLPVATPPNAIVFSSRFITIPQMAKAGLWMNLIACLVIAAFVLLVLPLLWDIDLGAPLRR